MNRKILVVGLILTLLIVAVLLIYKIVFNATTFKSAPAAEINMQETLQTETAYLEAASLSETRNELIKAKEVYQKIIEKFPNSKNLAKTQEAFDNINIKILFSPQIMQDAFLYEIQKGDNLTKIAKSFATTIELISKTNNLKDSNIKIGKKIKISNAKFSIVVDKSQNILTLKSNNEIFKTYCVSTGKNSCTPIGNFKITNKIIDPPWYPPAGGVIQPGDPKNVLGSRWMGISIPSYGIHGTTESESIGKSVTEGCVRMKNSDAEELYTIIPEGTEVVIID